MFWSRSLYSASRNGATPVMTLREATQTARRMGCLGTPPNTTPAAPSCSPSTASTPVADPLLLRRCTGADARGSNTPSPSEATWSGIVLRQRQLFQNSHTPSDGGAVAVSVSAVNTIHVEGEVAAVWCGYEASNSSGRAGDGFPNRRTVSMTTPVNRDFPTVLLWLSMEDLSGRADTSCLLAVRCRLSPEVVELRWRAQQQAAAANADGDAEKSSAVKEAGVDARLRCVKAWASTALLHRRVVVSGQLRVSEVYDGDLDAVVAVPVVELPQDNLLGSVTVLRSEKVKLSKVSQF